MNADLRRELEEAIRSNKPLDHIVAVLRRSKEQGAAQDEVYEILETLRKAAPDESTEDRILEVADFVAGFCSPHMRVWDATPGA